MVSLRVSQSLVRKIMTRPMHSTYAGLGTNLGDRLGNIRHALSKFAPDIIVKEISGVYETEPVGVIDQPRFLNLAFRAETELPPEGLLRRIKEIEKDLGRTESIRNGPRLIDIDILLCGDVILKSSDLTIPHPRMHERAFVLVPLADIAPNAMHPIFRKTVTQLRDMLPSYSSAVKLVSEL